MKEPIIRTHNREIDELFERYRRAPGSHVFAPLADAYRKLGLMEEALDICARGLAANPRYASGYVVQGKCQFDAGRADRAEESFKKVLEIDGQNLVALRYLGIIRAGCGDTEGARGYFEQILVLDPDDKEIRQRLDAVKASSAPVTATSLVEEIEQVLEDAPMIPIPASARVEPACARGWNRPQPRIEPVTQQIDKGSLDKDDKRSLDKDEVMDLPEVRDEFEGSPILLGDDSVTTEYIATVTLADIFASQGYAAKALKIYQDVMRRQPDNQVVLKKIAALERGERIVRDDGDEHGAETGRQPGGSARPDSGPRAGFPRGCPSGISPVPTASQGPSFAPTTPAGAAIDEGRSYEQFKRWLRTVSD